ncbi:putative CRM domain-containing protein, chloroplastic [Vitis vinifera]|uniref:Putative CRM domain-containing protein, chloroplastic n=1 Tax=Vitis vinifera TaxID=29760 RepID=A0A438GUL0_VITVI|nr:putative CRM domain-containing protein, chloroplastic [Vitis vinifera]
MKAFHSKRSLISEISPRLSFYNAAHPRRLGSFARNPAKFPERISSLCNVICKVFGSQSPFGPLHGIRWFLLARHSWIHSCSFLNLADKVAEPEKLPVDSTTAAGTVETKVKRKKLKGKRAVVRWLKFFRWKKKKEYERMAAEEKILYKLRKARRKEERLAEALTKIEPKESSETTHDPEILTPEEHFFFLKMGLKCKNYVPIGRRGIYQGVILNMHLHWKKHQTLQVVVKTFSPEEVKEIAVELARLTGGIVLDIHEENTIIMYRGKNYSQPPTEIMSPRITLSRKSSFLPFLDLPLINFLFLSPIMQALDKSSTGMVSALLGNIYQDLKGTLSCFKHRPKCKLKTKQKLLKISKRQHRQHQLTRHSNLQPENSDKLRELLAGNNESSEEESLTDSGTESCSEALSDIFESDSDTDTKEKAEQLLYLNEFEKFPVESDGEPEDFEEHLRQISADSRKAKSLEKDADLPQLDEVDQMFLRAASLLKKKRR